MCLSSIRSQREEGFLFSPPLFLTLLFLPRPSSSHRLSLSLPLLLFLLLPSCHLLSPSHPSFLTIPPSFSLSLSLHYLITIPHHLLTSFLSLLLFPSLFSLWLCSSLVTAVFPSSNSSRRLALGLEILHHLSSFQFLPRCQKRLQKRQLRRLKILLLTFPSFPALFQSSHLFIQYSKRKKISASLIHMGAGIRKFNKYFWISIKIKDRRRYCLLNYWTKGKALITTLIIEEKIIGTSLSVCCIEVIKPGCLWFILSPA